MTLKVEITKLTGGYEVAIEDREDRAVASTPRQAAKRAAEMIEEALKEEEKG